jgi:hypothetical protein
LIAVHVLILNVWSPARFPVRAIYEFPVAALVDCCLLLVSMLQYEFATVTWKERNVCIPVMHVIPHLPVLKD